MHPELPILAPVSGRIIPLDHHSDPRQVHRLQGDGVAIATRGHRLHAPVTGVVLASARPRSLVIRTDTGIDVMVDLPIDGELLFAIGTRVRAGQEFASLDQDIVNAASDPLLVLVLVDRPDHLLSMAEGDVEAGTTVLRLTTPPDAAAGWRPLLAPLSGILIPLEQVPDPVFAGRMVGDGISIDPTDAEVLAPCDGTVSQFHPSCHALTITADDGLEVLIHVGIDTVRLRGEGFHALVSIGDRVSAGQPLLRFDTDTVACGAASLLTQVLVANGERLRGLRAMRGRVVAGKDAVALVQVTPGGVPLAMDHSEGPGDVERGPLTVPNPAGLHARPAAALVAAAKGFTSLLTIERLAHGGRPAERANLRSLVSILRLGTRHGDQVRVIAHGKDAEAAADAIVALITSGCGEESTTITAQAAAPAPAAIPADQGTRGQLLGVAASSGMAIGTVYRMRRQTLAVPREAADQAAERRSLDRALVTAGDALESEAYASDLPEQRQIRGAHRELIDDPDLRTMTETAIADGCSAAWGWRQAVDTQAAALESLANPLLRERAADVRDIGRRVLCLLLGVDDRPTEIPPGSIVIAEELTPSDTARFTRDTVLGFCTTTGGATSHVAILARALGIPAVCGADPAVLAIPGGTRIILDGNAGVLNPCPDPAALAEAEAARSAQERQAELHRSTAHHPAKTRDGRRIEVVANVTNASEATAAMAAGGEGVGLLRSEFLFDHRATAPGEDEQAEAYLAVATAVGPQRPLVIRTLDVGGDKPLAYLPLPKEDNPFLGLRGIRVSLDRPDILRPQVRAILRSAVATQLHIMFPMVTSVDEFLAARAILEEERADLGVPPVQVGVMIEVPAAALLAGHLAEHADFFSIGTNDLTQYILAMDRGHPRLARQADALHPAVLTAIHLTCQGAHAHGRWVGVCGGLAGDALAVPALIGLGVDELSVPVPAIPAIKAAVARCDHRACTTLARELLTLNTAAAVRSRLTDLTATSALAALASGSPS